MDITKPKPGALRIILDTLGILVFGGWFFGGIAVIIFAKQDPSASPCAGPGFVDYGCMGGRDAVIGNSIATVFMAGLFILFLICFVRLVNRVKSRQ